MPFRSYEEACSAHRWVVPSRYNLAADVCEKHPRDKLAMVWESFDGSHRALVWGELQDLANQAAHTLAAHGVERGDRVAIVLPPTPETAAIFFGVWKIDLARDCHCRAIRRDDFARHTS
jgi:acetyl-CoA synthetase